MLNMQALTINRKKYGIKIQEVYFTPTYESYQCDLRVNFCVPTASKSTTESLTSVINLTQTSEKILANFRLSHRRGIETTLNSPELNYRFIKRPSSGDILAFCNAYNNFAINKKLPLCNQNKLFFFAGQKALVITNVHHADTGDLLCQHAFISNKERARLLYSVSNFRVHANDSFQRRYIGKVHRSLHWFEINKFKDLDYKIYDLGGLAQCQDPQLDNINYFKRGFGGEELKEYVNFIPQNLKGWIAMRYLMKKL